MFYTAALYVLLCLFVGFVGRWSRLGFWGVVLVSLAVTPVVTGLCFLFLSDRFRPLTAPASRVQERYSGPHK